MFDILVVHLPGTSKICAGPGRDKSPVRLPGVIEISLGQSEVQSVLPEWAIKI